MSNSSLLLHPLLFASPSRLKPIHIHTHARLANLHISTGQPIAPWSTASCTPFSNQCKPLIKVSLTDHPPSLPLFLHRSHSAKLKPASVMIIYFQQPNCPPSVITSFFSNSRRPTRRGMDAKSRGLSNARLSLNLARRREGLFFTHHPFSLHYTHSHIHTRTHTSGVVTRFYFFWFRRDFHESGKY